MDKKLYFQFSDNADVSNIILTLDGCKEWIENDEYEDGDEVEYTIVPVWLTDEEVENLPEANI